MTRILNGYSDLISLSPPRVRTTIMMCISYYVSLCMLKSLCHVHDGGLFQLHHSGSSKDALQEVLRSILHEVQIENMSAHE
jgi:hypothetical protein